MSIKLDDIDSNPELYLPQLAADPKKLDSVVQLLKENTDFVKDHADLSERIISLLKPNEAKEITKLIHTTIFSKNPLMLHDAILKGDEYKIIYLIKEGFPTNNYDKNGDTPLTLAIKMGDRFDQSLLVDLINSGRIDVNLPDREGNTPLHHAAFSKSNDNNVIGALLLKGADINKPNRTGATVLHLLALANKAKLLETLIFMRGDVNARDVYGQTPLHIACDNGRKEAASSLLNQDADPNVANVDGITPMHIVAQRGYFEIFRDLYYFNAEVDPIDKNGTTPLQMAIQKGQDKLQEQLVLVGAVLDIQSTNAKNLFFQAAAGGRRELLAELIKKGMPPDVRDSEGLTALMHASRGHFVEIIEDLCKSGVDVNATDKNGMTASMHACLFQNYEALYTLANHKANLDLVDNRGLMILDYLFAIQLPEEDAGEDIAKLKVDFKKFAETINLADPEEKPGLLQLAEQAPSVLFNPQVSQKIIYPVRDKFNTVLRSMINTDVAASTKEKANVFKAKCPVVDLTKVATSALDALTAQRTAGSTTLKAGLYLTEEERKKALNDWKQIDLKIGQAALQKTPMTLTLLSDINRVINKTGRSPGYFRKLDHEITAGGSLLQSYVFGEAVDQELNYFDDWFRTEIANCDKGEANPIVIAAKAYQWLISIHPFSDANGRTCRFVMDYILQRYGLPPASLGDDVDAAIFIFKSKNVTPDDAVEMVMKGILKSYEILGIKI